MTQFDLLILLVVAAVGAYIFLVKGKGKPVDMDHKAPNVHNVQMEGKVGPATAADKPAPAKKKVVKKTTAKKAPAKKKTAAKKKTVAKK